MATVQLDFRPGRRFDIHEQPMLVAVDPGEVHVGVAVFVKLDTDVWVQHKAFETTPYKFIYWFINRVTRYNITNVVVEDFVLQPNTAGTQAGSRFVTVQLIGQISLVCRLLAWLRNIRLDKQMNKIKRPTYSVIRHRCIELLSVLGKVGADHASDAEVHGFYNIWNILGEQVSTLGADMYKEQNGL